MNSRPTLSPHFSWEEACITSHRGIDNSIPSEIEGAIRSTAARMEIVRAVLGTPILVNSWYRCPALNTAIGGTSGSQHIRGEAVDFISPFFGSPLLICKRLISHITEVDFDQLILEHSWIHVSFRSDPSGVPRRQVLTLLRDSKYAVGLTNKDGVPV